MNKMSIYTIKKYKIIKDENGNKIQLEKTKEEWDKETCGGKKIYGFIDRYKVNDKTKQYKSRVFEKKREAEAEERLFLLDPIKYIQEHSKRAKNSLKIANIDEDKKKNDKNLNDYFVEFNQFKLYYIKGASVYEDKKNWNNHISDELGELFPEEVTFEVIHNWHEKVNKKINDSSKAPYSTKTKNKWHSTLTEFLQFLISKGKLKVNYAKAYGQFKNPKENKNQKKKIKFQTLEQYELFMSVVHDFFWKAFFNFLFWHGCRIGEQRALKIKDVDFEHGTVHFHNTFTKNQDGKEELGPIKNGKERTIYLDEHCIDDLKKLVECYKLMDGYTEEWFLFGGIFNTYKNRIERKLKEYYTKLQNFYPNEKIIVLTHHEFGRHSHASYMLDLGIKKGINREEIYSLIAQRLGDTVDVIKRVYAHPYEDDNINKTKELLKI